MPHQLSNSLPYVNGNLFGLLRQKLIIKWNHFAVWTNIILLEGLLKSSMKMQ